MTPEWIRELSTKMFWSASSTTADIQTALLSVASRVERETREADLTAIRSLASDLRSNDGFRFGAAKVAEKVRALPRQYKET